MGEAIAFWHVAFLVLYPIELCCLIAAMLLMTRRLLNVLIGDTRNGLTVGRFGWMLSIAAASICGLAGLAGNIVVAKSHLQLFYLSSDGVYAIAANNSVAAAMIQRQFSDKAAASLLAASIQPLNEAFVLALNVVVIFLATTAVIRRFRSVSRGLLLDSVLVSRMMWRMIVACAAVALTLCPRAAYAAFRAFTIVFQNNTDTCVGACDSSCMNQFSLMQRWLDFTPEFRVLVVLVSSPLLMLIVLWSMTTSRMTSLIGGRLDQHAPLLGPALLPPRVSLDAGDALGFQPVYRAVARAARLFVTPMELDSSSSTFFQTKDPEATASDSSRCRYWLRPAHVCFTQISRSFSICLAPLAKGEEVRLLPCMHMHHKACVDPWIMQRNQCPVCRCFSLVYALFPPSPPPYTHQKSRGSPPRCGRPARKTSVKNVFISS